MSETATTSGAREHARAQAGAVVEAMPTVPASLSPDVPSGIDPRLMTWAEIVAGGAYTSKVLARGTRLRLRDRDGHACAHLLLFNAEQPWERLNAADTVKVPWQAYLGPAHPLLSDQGRVLATIVGDYCNGASDALCGVSTKAMNEAKYGDGSAHGETPAGRELLKLAAAKHGLEPRDIPPSISFFKRVRVTESGELNYTGSCYEGGHFDLRAELPLIVLIANVPHPLDPREQYTCSPLEVLAWRGMATTPADPLWSFSPELERAYLNTADYVSARRLDD
jgi:urea carboxylase-associated protein 2